MIAINDCNGDIARIKDQHLAFVENRVERNISFYLQVFNLLDQIRHTPRITNNAVNRKIAGISNGLNVQNYISLIKPILKKKYALNLHSNFHHLKFPDRRFPDANNNHAVLDALIDLHESYKDILALDFNGNPIYVNRMMRLSVITLSSIDFLLPTIFDYDNWFAKLSPTAGWGPYQLTKELGINACPYCNRQYIFTITTSSGAKVARPELDHFLPKAKNPLFALSFYNLIPSCTVCNSSIKGSGMVSVNTHLNPYFSNPLHALMRFTYRPKTYEASIGEDDLLDVKLVYNGNPTNRELRRKIDGNIDLFCLNDIYAYHADTVQEIIRKRAISNDKYIQNLQKTYHSFNLSTEDAYRLAFGNFYNESDFHKRPLAKLTKDIAIELKVLRKFKK